MVASNTTDCIYESRVHNALSDCCYKRTTSPDSLQFVLRSTESCCANFWLTSFDQYRCLRTIDGRLWKMNKIQIFTYHYTCYWYIIVLCTSTETVITRSGFGKYTGPVLEGFTHHDKHWSRTFITIYLKYVIHKIKELHYKLVLNRIIQTV